MGITKFIVILGLVLNKRSDVMGGRQFAPFVGANVDSPDDPARNLTPCHPRTSHEVTLIRGTIP
mgnify:CR=1 FL=1